MRLCVIEGEVRYITIEFIEIVNTKRCILMTKGIRNHKIDPFFKKAKQWKEEFEKLNVQAARQLRFTNVQQIDEMQLLIKTYIDEAIEVEKAGVQVEYIFFIFLRPSNPKPGSPELKNTCRIFSTAKEWTTSAVIPSKAAAAAAFSSII
ncbi:hypothetical protein B0G52_111148 [Cohnella sp. SGD-V74]|nr:hypothetical protein B0G52_111148 [Cohnella sp. SGD-V74]